MSLELLSNIFSIAAGLDESGRLKNTVYCGNREIFILNNESTILLQIILPPGIAPFKHPVSFVAADYEMGNFYEKEGFIIFPKPGQEFNRTKSCRPPGRTLDDIKILWGKFDSPSVGSFTIHQDSMNLLDDNLSHVEVQVVDGSLVLIQRDIFSGSIITLNRKTQGKTQGELGVNIRDKLPQSFGPVGIRTSDLKVLFAFQKEIKFLLPEAPGYFRCQATSGLFPMEGIIALCVYDELGTIAQVQKEESNGWKEQEVRVSQPRPNPTNQGRNRRSCVKKVYPGKGA
jgi:hypothetical protein